jgi:hypothetical protein
MKGDSKKNQKMTIRKKEKIQAAVVTIENELNFSISIHERRALIDLLRRCDIPDISTFVRGLFFQEDGELLKEGAPHPVKDKIDRIALLENDGVTVSSDGALLLKTMLLVYKNLSKLFIADGRGEKIRSIIEQNKRVHAALNYLYPKLIEIYNTFYDKALEIHSALEATIQVTKKRQRKANSTKKDFEF